jgi:hypothetical protein|tara:strand:+ start:155 stop:307 length:153 start_codon:yes stop_codon:yes gene_type:complete
MKKKEGNLDKAFDAIVEGLRMVTTEAFNPLINGNRDKPKKEKKKPKKEKK